MRPFTALALTSIIWHCAAQSCPPQTSCDSCLFVKDSAGITLCGWCRNPNITSEGFCESRTMAAVQQCIGNFEQDGNSHDYLVLVGTNCELPTNQNTLIAAVAGSVGGIIFAVAFIYIYYRKKKQKQERLATFRRRELEMHRSRKLKLDKELGMQSGAASNNQRQMATQQLEKQQMEYKTQEMDVVVEPPPPTFEEAIKSQRRRFKCMSKGGLRVREAPTSESTKVGGIKFEVIVTALSVKGNWVQVSANGWAMIESEDGSKVFLKELGEGDEEETPSAPEPDVFG